MQASELPLRDIHLSEVASWWPPAIGWWLLAIIIALFIFLGYWLYRRPRHAKLALKSAKIKLAELKQDSGLDGGQKLARLSILLRRVAISLSPDRTVAGLTGQAWLAYLDRPMNGSPFSNGMGRLLIESPYQRTPPTAEETDQLFALCESWLKTCNKKP